MKLNIKCENEKKTHKIIITDVLYLVVAVYSIFSIHNALKLLTVRNFNITILADWMNIKQIAQKNEKIVGLCYA